MDVIALHERTVAEFLRRVETVPDGGWEAPTPCADWSVRELVNHVVGEERWTVPLLAGATIADVGDSLDGDLLGDDPLAATRSASEAAVAGAASIAPDETTVHLSYGDEAATEYLHQLAADHLVHAWDLAVATGGDARLDLQLVAAVAEWFAAREDLYRGAGIIGERIETNDDDPQAALIGRFGRDPAWPKGRRDTPG